MRKSITTIIILLCICSPGKADYAMPSKSHALKSITSILDVEVTEITKEGYAKLKILGNWKSGKNVPSMIKGTHLSCTGGTPKMWGMKQGKRYVVLLIKDSLFEESSFFEVKDEEGILKCKLGWYRSWFDLKKEWISLDSLKKKLGIS